MDERWNLVPALHFDTAAIKNSIKIEDAVKQYTGQEPNRGGFIKCPDPTHLDDKPSCKVYTKTNNCKCFSCNGFFTVFDLAAFSKGLDVKTDFPTICREVCNDFGIDVYSVSNLHEREQAYQQAFGEEETEKVKFKEYFPLTQSELEYIGIYGKGKKPQKGDFENELPEMDIIQYAREFESEERFFDKDGKPKTKMFESAFSYSGRKIELQEDGKYHFTDNGELITVTLTYDEAEELCLIEPFSSVIENWEKKPTVQDGWKMAYETGMEELKTKIEKDMVIHIDEKIRDVESELEKCQKEKQLCIDEYTKTHDVEREKKLYEISLKKDSNIHFSPAQLERIKDYGNHQISISFIDNSIRLWETERSKCIKILGKLEAFYDKKMEHKEELKEQMRENRLKSGYDEEDEETIADDKDFEIE